MVPSLLLPGQFAPRSESANRTLANSLPGTFTPWPSRSLANSFPGLFAPEKLSFPGAFAPLMCHRRVLWLSYTYEQNSMQCLSVLQK